MVQKGCFYGHLKENYNPGSKRIVAARVGSLDIIDLEKTVSYISKAQKFIVSVVSAEGVILFVGTKRQAKKIVKDTAEDIGMPYVSERWLGGTLTNFQTIRRRINYFERLEVRLKTGAFEKKTKEEKNLIEREIESLRKNFDGLKKLKDLPQALVIVDPNVEHVALKEAKILGIPVVATSDTNIDTNKIDYPIPINDDSSDSIEIFMRAISDAVKEGLRLQTIQKVSVKKEV